MLLLYKALWTVLLYPPYSLQHLSSFVHQRLLVEMEGFKQQVAAVQQCQSALRLPEEVVASLPICRTAQSLQQEASQLQHTTIQQCNILQVEGSANSDDQLSNIRSNLTTNDRAESYNSVTVSY